MDATVGRARWMTVCDCCELRVDGLTIVARCRIRALLPAILVKASKAGL
jgi:hypothetical protein